MKPNKTQREQIKNYLETQTQYKADSMRISADGAVTARKDADKTFNGPHTTRYLVGSVTEILRKEDLCN